MDNADSSVVNQETAHLSGDFVSSGYNFETKATQPRNESSDRGCVTRSQDSPFDSNNHADCEGELLLNKVSFEDEHCYAMPEAVDLNISGLRRSQRIRELNMGQSYTTKLMEESKLGLDPVPAEGMTHTTNLVEESKLGLELSSKPAERMAHTTIPVEGSKLGLTLFSLFCTATALTPTALTSAMHAPAKVTKGASSSILYQTLESFHRVNM